jgi:transcription-repair coupling factor (superfamily II helicase)
LCHCGVLNRWGAANASAFDYLFWSSYIPMDFNNLEESDKLKPSYSSDKLKSSYSEELTNQIIEMYKRGDSMDHIAAHAGKSVSSIRAKLVHEKAYRQFATQRMRAIERGEAQAQVDRQIVIKPGDDCYTQLTEFLAMNYVMVATVRQQGDYNQLGGVIEVWGYGDSQPVRFDYFGETLERIIPDNEKCIIKAD